MGFFDKKKIELRIGTHEGDGSFDFQVVGEKSYREVLISIIRANNAFDQGELVLKAILIPEPENEFDPRAIKVTIDDRTVGYVPRSQTGDFHELFKANKLGALKLNAKIGWDTENATPPIGVRLDISVD